MAMLSDLKPNAKQLVYDLVTQAGVETSDWANFDGDHPTTNPKYCYDWAFWDDSKRVVVICLWFSQMREENGSVYQVQNLRTLASKSGHKDPSIAVRAKRARRVDMAFQLASNRNLPVRVIVVDGTRRGEEGADTSDVERRMLDPESWHVAAYDDDGNCRLVRGLRTASAETFTPAEINALGSFFEGAKVEVKAQIRERSQLLRDLARDHFAAQSADGRLHCAACDWTPPLKLELNSPIVEIHHGIGISTYPTDGKALTFAEAIIHLTPLCPNCHRVLHAKPGGGTFTLAELQKARI